MVIGMVTQGGKLIGGREIVRHMPKREMSWTGTPESETAV